MTGGSDQIFAWRGFTRHAIMKLFKNAVNASAKRRANERLGRGGCLCRDAAAHGDAARRRDDGEAVTLEASCCKLYASEMVGRVADRAVQIFGGAGYIAEYGIERLYRDVRIFRIYEGTSQVQQIVIARETMKRGG